MNEIWELIKGIATESGLAQIFTQEGNWKNLIMIIIALVLLYCAIFRKAEPYLLIPIGFGMLLANFPGDIGIFSLKYADLLKEICSEGLLIEKLEIDPAIATKIWESFINANPGIDISSITFEQVLEHVYNQKELYNILTVPQQGDLYSYLNDKEGLIGYLYMGVKYGIYPCLIFLGIGATTDFGPLIANPKSMLLGAAAQIGIFITFLVAIALPMFDAREAASIGIIGGADGPTAILVTTNLAPHRLAAISVAAYSYMALVPFIQPPIIRALTTKEERLIKMEQLRDVSKLEKIIFPILVTLVVVLLIPSCAPLIGCLMFGNLIKESGVVPKLLETASNALLYIVTILLGICVGATATGETFLNVETLLIFGLGIIAFMTATAFGVLFGKIMCKATHGKVNPMIGAAGVSAVPMAARVVQKEGLKEDPTNFLLMHAMGPNVAGVIGSAIAAGILLTLFL